MNKSVGGDGKDGGESRNQGGTDGEEQMVRTWAGKAVDAPLRLTRTEARAHTIGES